jgi:hypothetical protein
MTISILTISVLVGAAILLFGRKLFWLFVAAIGFAAGVEFAAQVLPQPSPVLTLLVSLGLGILGAFLAYVFQKFAIAIAGFISGGRFALALSAAFYIRHAESSGIIFLIGGILGAILLIFLFDWAIILMSSVEGARLILSVIVLPPAGCVLLLTALIVIGIIVQSRMLRHSRTNA